MNKPYLTGILLAAALFSASPGLYDGDRALYTINTAWFDIIFPAESALTARYLASFADDMYVGTSALLGTQPRHRLTVVITADSERTSGYFTNYPYLRIVLFQAATDLNSSIGGFKDDLRSLFLHELTHAVSHSIRGPIQEALVSVFGSPLGLSMYTTPLNFVEGVTVAMESRDGSGRTNDPLAGGLIRQDLLEGRFKNFIQTMGTWDRYPERSLFYIYGGYFSRYLQERYGMMKYAELWQQLGSGMLTRPLDDILFIQGHFSKVYGISLRQAWNDFGESMSIQSTVLESGQRITGLSSFEALAAAGPLLYWADSAEDAVFSHAPASGETRRLFSVGASVSRLAPSEDGLRILVSVIEYDGGHARLAIHEWDRASGEIVKLPYRGLRDACYVSAPTEEEPEARQERPDETVPTEGQFMAIRIQGYETSVVIVQKGTIHPVLIGSEKISYASPVASPDGWIYVLAKEEGIVSVVRFRLSDMRATELERLVVPAGLGWIRYLSLDEGILRFAWDDALFYRLAELDGELLRYQIIPSAGGIHQAVGSAGSVFYLGNFSEGMAVCSFPENRERLGFAEVIPMWEGADRLTEAQSVYGAEGTYSTGMEAELGIDAMESQRYSVLPWLLPRFWHPTIAGDSGGLNMVGAAAYFADPIETISGYLSAGWNPQTRTPGFDAEMNLDFGSMFLRFTVHDRFESRAMDLGPDSALRLGSAGISLNGYTLPFVGGSTGFGFSGVLQAWSESIDMLDRYTTWDVGLVHAGVLASRQDMKSIFGRPGTRRGYTVSGTLRGIASVLPDTAKPQFGLETSVDLAAGFLGLELSVNAGLSLSEGLTYGPTGAVLQTAGLGEVSIQTYTAYQEFQEDPAGGWHVQAELTLRPFSFELQQGIGLAYARRLDLRAGYRGAATKNEYALENGNGLAGPTLSWSLFARLDLAFSPAVGTLATSRPVAWIELWYRPLDETWGLGYVKIPSF